MVHKIIVIWIKKKGFFIFILIQKILVFDPRTKKMLIFVDPDLKISIIFLIRIKKMSILFDPSQKKCPFFFDLDQNYAYIFLILIKKCSCFWIRLNKRSFFIIQRKKSLFFDLDQKPCFFLLIWIKIFYPPNKKIFDLGIVHEIKK